MYHLGPVDLLEMLEADKKNLYLQICLRFCIKERGKKA